MKKNSLESLSVFSYFLFTPFRPSPDSLRRGAGREGRETTENPPYFLLSLSVSLPLLSEARDAWLRAAEAAAAAAPAAACLLLPPGRAPHGGDSNLSPVAPHPAPRLSSHSLALGQRLGPHDPAAVQDVGRKLFGRRRARRR